ncbi:MAG: M1 family aminopeptidase [Betaproteobacteria bacterium]|nr:M1 family aminopeptidase [Betaproteobacteria bacterium]
MRAGAALLLLLAAHLPAASGQSPPRLEPGVSQELARWRAQHYRDLRYALDARIDGRAQRLAGRLEITVTLARRVDLVLDWRGAPARALRANGKPVRGRHARAHLVIARADLVRGVNRIELEFAAPIAVAGRALTRYRDREDGSSYVYSLFVPADASSVFPCVDQPDLKARFALRLRMPRAWRAISNAPALEEAPGHARFAETEPISTYLFAFAAGPFEALAQDGEPVRLFVRRSQLARARAHAEEVLRLNRLALAFFEAEFGRRFPFAKYDLVLVPELAYGGMEHAGATFLREQAIVFPDPPSRPDLLRRAQLIFHEASHQWFGNLVTMRWFDDLWLKEGFANFMAAKAAAAIVPELEPWSAFHALKTGAYRTDVTAGTTALRQPLANLAAAKSAYGSIVYSKGPAVLRQAEFYLGEHVFRRAMRDFLQRHAYGAADWSDLVRAFERVERRDLQAWAAAWVQRRGLPTVTLREAGAGVQLVQEDAQGQGGVWPQKLVVAAATADGSVVTSEVRLERAAAAVTGPAGQRVVRWRYPNAGDFGYGRFLLDAASRDALLAEPRALPDGLLRAQLVEALWESVRDAELAPTAFIEFALALAPEEGDDVIVAGLLARVEAAFRRYLSDAQRDRLAPRLERTLLGAVLGDGPESRRLLMLRAFVALAWTDAALADLKRLHEGSLAAPGVALGERDRFRLIARLLMRADADGPRLLAEAIAAERGDNARRYAFAASAALADADAKRAMLRRFAGDAGLPESWIEEALAPFNAPEHAAHTAPLLGTALARLPELRRRSKIFFVEHWLGAFLAGQTDARALATVQGFLRGDLEPDLRLKVLEALDGLERTVRIRERFADAADR